LAPAPQAAETNESQAILVIHSYHSQLQWSEEQRRGLDAVFSEAQPPVIQYTEFLDAKRFPQREYNQPFLALLQSKYAHIRFAAAVATDAPALRFLIQQRRLLAETVPIFFTGVTEAELPEFEQQPRITGVVEALDIGKTLALAVSLQPEARRVFVLHDLSESGLVNRGLVEAAARDWSGRLKFDYLGPSSLQQVFDRLRALSNDTFVLHTGLAVDAEGRLVRPKTRREMAQACPVPIYVITDETFGDFGVAGSMLSGHMHGEILARMVLRYLGGVPLEQLPMVRHPPQRLRAHYERMKQFKLDPARLPPDTDVRERPNFYADYRWQIYTSASLILILGLSVLFLAVNIRERRRSEAAVRRTEALYRNAIIAGNAVPYLRNLPSGSYSFIGPGIQALTGYSSEELTPEVWNRLARQVTFHGDLARLPADEVQGKIRRGEITTWAADVLIQTRSGEERWVADVAVGERTEDSPDLHSIGILFDITQRKKAELRLATFTELGQRLSSASTLESAARIIVDSARRVLGWDACSIDLCEPETRHVTPILNLDTLDDEPIDVPPAYSGSNANSIVHRVIREGALLIQRPGPQPADDGLRPFGDTGRRSASLLFVPVREHRRAIGVLSIQSYKPGAYNEGALNTLQSLADLCGGAFERIRAQEQLRALNADLEQRVQNRTSELATAIRELEAFSYSVSHDLRAPLRHISGFASLIRERPSVQTDVVAARHLRTIVQAAGRLGQLIDDLLVFSRVGRTALNRVAINSAELVESARRELLPDLAGRKITWRIGVLPPVEGDYAMLKLAVHNLIANAVKYTSRREQAVIEVSGYATGGEIILLVKDNGAGFDMRYAGKLFGVFQRLHTDDQFEGTGIGLANVHRIVQRHGGRVWAEGDVGQGATFYLALPQTSDDEVSARQIPLAESRR
jgi:PAS domain S-box-containing protein